MKLTHTTAAVLFAAVSLCSASSFAQGAPANSTDSTTLGGARAPAATYNQTQRTTSEPNASALQTNNAASRTSAAPVPGRNSFTHGEASRRIAASGFTKVMGLKKDSQGIWRGHAQKDGADTAVSLDYQGNVTGK